MGKKNNTLPTPAPPPDRCRRCKEPLTAAYTLNSTPGVRLCRSCVDLVEDEQRWDRGDPASMGDVYDLRRDLSRVVEMLQSLHKTLGEGLAMIPARAVLRAERVEAPKAPKAPKARKTYIVCPTCGHRHTEVCFLFGRRTDYCQHCLPPAG